MKKILVLLLMMYGVHPVAQAQKNKKQDQQKVKFGDVTAADFAPTVYPIDSSAQAVYLYDAGSCRYEGNNNSWFSIIYKKHIRIRLMNKNSFDGLSTVKIPLYTTTNYEEKLQSFHAATYNIENGNVSATKIEKNTLFKEKDGNYTIMKFTFPNVSEGCIIEYDYELYLPGYRDVRSWYFQGKYPKLWSEYTFECPEFFDFVFLQQGYIPYVIDTATFSRQTFNLSTGGRSAFSRSEFFSVQGNTVTRRWAAQNVIPMKEEAFTTTTDNYISKIDFQLNAIRIPEQPVEPIMQNWYQAAEGLMKDEQFGLELTHGNNWLNDDVKKITVGAATSLEKAKNIFEFVRQGFITTRESWFLSQPLKKTFDSKKGNVTDLNILLVAMLKNAGFDAKPVLLSTRDNGKAYETYPVLDRFNYTIAKLDLDDKTYLLDAADGRVGFDRLPEKCYNGSGRVIDAQPILVQLSADSLHESKMTTVFVNNGEKEMNASFSTQLGLFESDDIRRRLRNTKEDEFFNEIKKAYTMDIAMKNMLIDSLKKIDDPVAIKYDFSFSTNDEDIIYFNPMMGEAYKENPFTSAERLYPVEMPYCSNETYILNMEIPKGYKVDELPKSARVKLNEEDGMFEYIIAQANGYVQMRCRIVINRATFEPDDYQTLRDFYAFIVAKQAEQVVFKKL